MDLVVAAYEGMDIRRFCGPSHQDSERFVTAIAHAKFVALQRLKAHLEIGENTLVPLWLDVVQEQVRSLPHGCDRAPLVGRIAAEKERLDGGLARGRSPHAKRFTVSEELKQASLCLRVLGSRR